MISAVNHKDFFLSQYFYFGFALINFCFEKFIITIIIQTLIFSFMASAMEKN